MGRILIVGAGAIGRGFLPWLVGSCDIDFLDSDQSLVSALERQGGYTTLMTQNGVLNERWISPKAVFSSCDFDTSSRPKYDAVFVCVGPRNVEALPVALRELECPFFSLENDPATIDLIRRRLKLEHVYFGVPDVITSSTASPDSLERDALSLHTENGVLYLDEAGSMGGLKKLFSSEVQWQNKESMIRDWDAKLYLHNTPHCVAAYLGSLNGRQYMHEAMCDPVTAHVVVGTVEEMLLSLKVSTDHDHVFLEAYAAKELARFENPLLFDPIARVARQPLRKLGRGGRLTGALRLALLSGVFPRNLLIGVAAALKYRPATDGDSIFMELADAMPVEEFLWYHTGLPSSSLEAHMVAMYLEDAFQCLL